MPVNILNLPGLEVVDFRETDAEYHVRATPKTISRLCPSCGPAGKVVIHQQKTLFVRDLHSHGRQLVCTRPQSLQTVFLSDERGG